MCLAHIDRLNKPESISWLADRIDNRLSFLFWPYVTMHFLTTTEANILKIACFMALYLPDCVYELSYNVASELCN